MRIILFTGKGGVGKTTTAAATALRASKLGHRTLVISTDPAHSLSDAFNVSLTPEPKQIAPNLWAQELDVYYSMQKYWGNLRQLMLTVFRWQGVESVLAEELSAIPGMEEGSAFMWIEKFYSEGNYDLIVIDSAPTGETLTLLTLPQVTKWWVTKAFPLQKFAIKTIGKGVRKTTGVPLDKGYEEMEHMFEKLERVQKIFADPDICSIRIVTNPERMVINESKRAYTYLQMYGYNVDTVIVNRVLPQLLQSDSFFGKYAEAQQKYLHIIHDSFAPVPIKEVEHQGEEVFGMQLLDKIATALYQQNDPADIFYKEKPFEVKQIGSDYRIRIKLPFIEDQQYSVKKFGDELVLEVGNRRKNIFLPRFANFMKMKQYTYNSPWFEVLLQKE